MAIYRNEKMIQTYSGIVIRFLESVLYSETSLIRRCMHTLDVNYFESQFSEVLATVPN